MDILAHGLWAGSGLAVAARRQRVARRTVVWTLLLAVLPDFMHAAPVVVWSLSGDSVRELWTYAWASPDEIPNFPASVAVWSHHLHCIFHSGLIAACVSIALWAATRRFWLPLLGWWSHILIDVFAHASDFYPSPVLYPLSYWGFDGIAWNTPWFMLGNYSALLGIGVFLLLKRRDNGQAPH